MKDRRNMDLSKWLNKYRDELMKKDNELRKKMKIAVCSKRGVYTLYDNDIYKMYECDCSECPVGYGETEQEALEDYLEKVKQEYLK